MTKIAWEVWRQFVKNLGIIQFEDKNQGLKNVRKTLEQSP
jgi:hypothetical protein